MAARLSAVLRRPVWVLAAFAALAVVNLAVLSGLSGGRLG